MDKDLSRRGLLEALGAAALPSVPCGPPRHQRRIDRAWRKLPPDIRPHGFVNYYGEPFPFPALVAPGIHDRDKRSSWPSDEWALSCAVGDPIPLSRSGHLARRLLSDEPSESCLHLGEEPLPRFVALLQQLEERVTAAAAPGAVLVPVGAHHSCSGAYRPSAFGPAVAVDVGGLNLVSVLPQQGPSGGPLVLCGGGARICELNEALWALGLALPTMGSFDVQTLAGATATGTHGSSATVGAISDAIVALVVLACPSAPGAQARWSVLQLQARPEDAPLAPFAERMIADGTVFEAFLVSMGLLGIVVAAVIEAREAFFLHSRYFPRRWREIRPEMRALAVGPPPGVRGKGWRYELHVNPVAVRRFLDTPLDAPSLGSTGEPEWVAAEFTADEWSDDPDYLPEIRRLRHLEAGAAGLAEAVDLGWLRPSMQFTRELYSSAAGVYADRSYRVLREEWTDAVRAWGAEWFVELEHATDAVDWLLGRNLELGYGHRDRLLDPFAVRFVPTRRGLLCPSRYAGGVACAIEPSIIVRQRARESGGVREVLARWSEAFLAEADRRGWKARFHWGLVNDPFDQAHLERSYEDLDAWREVFLTFNRHGHFDTALGRQLGLEAWRTQHRDRPGAYEGAILP
jgi:hypothetical protein